MSEKEGPQLVPQVMLPDINGYITDRRRNPSAFTTLSLLAQIHFRDDDSGLTAAEIIARRHGGIYPTRTTEELQMLVNAGMLSLDSDDVYAVSPYGQMELNINEIQDPRHVERVLKNALDSILASPPVLPEEKYGNEEFRFTWESTHALMQKILRDNAYARVNIAAIGAPLLGIFASRCPEVFNSVAVFDINDDIVDVINNSDNKQSGVVAAKYDARNPFPPVLNGSFDSMVFDPPWHNEYYCLFADRGWEALRPLGRVYMSTFSPATRPEASGELTELYNRFIAGGYNLTEITPQFFGYQIPEFERKVFDAKGISVTSRGNYGQLVVLERGSERNTPCLTSDMEDKLFSETHQYLILGSDRGITLWSSTASESNILGIEVVNDGGVYTTTSRSQRVREGVNIISSDHIAFRCTNPHLLLIAYEYWVNGVELHEAARTAVSKDRYDDESRAQADFTIAFEFFNNHL